MVLRLSSQSSFGSTGSSGSSPTKECMNRLVQDTSLSLAEKNDALKTLSVIVKNLVDPVKLQDVKYRTLKLDNAKLQAKVFRISYLKEYIVQVLGFSETQNEEGTPCLILSTAPVGNTLVYIQNCLDAIVDTQKQVSTTAGIPAVAANKKAKVEDFENLSEKQKANRIKAEKEKMEKLKEKEARKRTSALIKADKFARENDPNWTPGVCAAAAKSGTGLQSFRDRHGE